MTAATLPSFATARQDPLLITAFERFIETNVFPCVGAKSALHRRQLHCVVDNDLRAAPTAATRRSLQRFSEAYKSDSPLFQSVALLFHAPEHCTEIKFEQLLWRYLQRLHDADARQYKWDPRVSRDPASPQFSFSIGGRGFYVVGLHPGARRSARRFERPVLVFNLHDQFERLRQQDRYHMLRNTIVERDTRLDGCPNPMLKTFGRDSEARQYSGRQVDDAWECPFSAK